MSVLTRTMGVLTRLLVMYLTVSLSSQVRLGDVPSIYYKPGNVTMAALLPIHSTSEQNVCHKLQPYGLGFAETLIYCVELINNSSGILRDVTLGYDIRDYCESPTLGMTMTHDFVKQNFMIDFSLGACGNTSQSSLYSLPKHAQKESHISSVIGAYDSGTTVLIAELLGVVNIPIISPFSTSEQLSNYPTFFRTIPPDGLQARAMADLITMYNWSYVGVVAVDHSYGRYGVMYLEKEAEKTRKFCTGQVSYFNRLGYQMKMESIVQKLRKQKQVRVIVLWANSAQTIDFLKTAHSMGLHDRVWILSDDVSAVSNSVLSKISNQVSGVFFGVSHRHYKYPQLSQYFMRMLKNPRRNKWWAELFEAEFNCSVPGFASKHFPACNHSKLDFSRILDSLYNSYTPYLVDSVQAIARALNAIYNCSKDTCPTTHPFINPADLIDYIKKVSFKGLTGEVGFDNKGNPISSSYEIILLQNNSHNLLVKTKVGNWSLHGGLQIDRKLIKWTIPEKKAPSSMCMGECAPGTRQTAAKNCCWECIPCEDGTVSLGYAEKECKKCPGLTVAGRNKNVCLEEIIVNVGLETDTGIVFAVIAGLGILFSFICLVLFIKYHTTPLVKASNRELSFLLLGFLIAGLTMSILHLALPTENICTFQNVWRYPIHCVCISILFIKTIRLAGAFQLDITGIPTFIKRFVVNSKLQVFTLVILNTCPLALAMLWSFLDNPYVITEKHEAESRIEYEFICKPYRGKTGMGFQLSSLSYLIVITLACIYYSFKARNLPGNFNETRYIGSSLYILLISWLAYYPINSLLKGWYATIISTATALLAWYGLLFCIFGPKIYIILIQPQMNTNEFVRAELRTANRGMNSVSAQSQCQ